MMDRNIFAYTAPGADFPEFLSINRKDGEIVVTVRSQGSSGNKIAEMTLPQTELEKLIYALRGARVNPLLGSKAPRYFVSMYTDGPATRWNVIDRQTQEWVRRFATEKEAQEYASALSSPH